MEMYLYLVEYTCEGNDLCMEMKESLLINEQNIAKSSPQDLYMEMKGPIII